VTLSSENWPEGDSQPRSLTFDTSDIEGYIEPPAGASMPASALGDFAERAPQVNLPLPRTAE
jgi:hypothetical protein